MELTNVIEGRDLTFAYGKKPIICNLDVQIPEGKITTLIGGNGCGKSTLFGILTGRLIPQKGKVFLRNKEINQIKGKIFAQEVAVVNQYNTAPPDITVEKLISYGRTPYQKIGIFNDKKKDQEMIEWAMETTNVIKYRHRNISQLSGGQRQRVWIAMALAQGTKIIFFDEPTTYLDIRYQLDILHLIDKLNKEYDMTITMILHDMNQAVYYSDHLIAMREGKIVAQGPPEIMNEELIHQVYDVHLDVFQIKGKPVVLAV